MILEKSSGWFMVMVVVFVLIDSVDGGGLVVGILLATTAQGGER